MFFVLRYLFLVLFATLSITFSMATSQIQDAYLSLSLDEINEDAVKLKGEAFFYYEKLYSLEDIQQDTVEHPLSLIGYSWSTKRKGYPQYDVIGYGTYYFQLRIPEELVGQVFVIRPTSPISQASKIIVNGVDCGVNGNVGASRLDPSHVPDSRINVYPFQADTCVLDIVIQCSNFSSPRAGVFKPLIFALEKNMVFYRDRALFVDLSILICLLAMSLYHLFSYGVDRGNLVSFFYAILCLVQAFYLVTWRELTIFVFFPNFPAIIFLHLVSLFFLPAVFTLFLDALIPSFVSKRFLYASFILALSCSIFIAFGNLLVIRIVLLIYYAAVIICFLYGFKLYSYMQKQKNKTSVLFLVSYLFLVVCVFNDILDAYEIIRTRSMLSFGVLFFTFFFAVFHGKRDLYIRLQLHKLTVKLQCKKDELNEKVILRNNELVKSLKELDQLNTFQNVAIDMISTDLMNSIDPFLNIKKIDETEYPKLKQSGQHMLNMIQNMLDIYRFTNNRFIIRKRQFDVTKTIDGVISDLTYLLGQKDVQIEVVSDKRYELEADVEVFSQVLYKLLANALQHSILGGWIKVQLQTTHDNCLKVSILTNGIPLRSDYKKYIFRSDFALNEIETLDGQKSVLHLYLCKLAIDAHDGNIGVDSDGISAPKFWFVLSGVSTIQTIDSLITTNAELQLTVDERTYLATFARQLLQIKIYDISKVDSVIEQVLNTTDAIALWCSNIQRATYQLDDDLYKVLLHQVLGEDN